MKRDNINTMWLNVNSYCNLRCKWCYVEGMNFNPENDMSFETAKALVDMAKEMGVNKVILLGGEPTYWKHLFTLTKYIHQQQMEIFLVTNGYLLSKDSFIEKIKNSPIKNIGISLKASNREQYIALTGEDVFEDIKKGITNAFNIEGKEAGVSYVLSKLTINSLRETADLLASLGVKHLAIDNCVVVMLDGKANKGYALEPKDYVQAIVDNIDYMSEVMGGMVTASQNTMGCIWPKDVLDRFIKEGKVTTGSCQMVSENGICFNSKGEMLPCNILFDYPVGKFGVDFFDAKSFETFRYSEELSKFFTEIKTFPLTKCSECNEQKYCIGGCPLMWLSFDPEKVISEACSK